MRRQHEHHKLKAPRQFNNPYLKKRKKSTENTAQQEIVSGLDSQNAGLDLDVTGGNGGERGGGGRTVRELV